MQLRLTLKTECILVALVQELFRFHHWLAISFFFSLLHKIWHCLPIEVRHLSQISSKFNSVSGCSCFCLLVSRPLRVDSCNTSGPKMQSLARATAKVRKVFMSFSGYLDMLSQETVMVVQLLLGGAREGDCISWLHVCIFRHDTANLIQDRVDVIAFYWRGQAVASTGYRCRRWKEIGSCEVIPGNSCWNGGVWELRITCSSCTSPWSTLSVDVLIC